MALPQAGCLADRPGDKFARMLETSDEQKYGDRDQLTLSRRTQNGRCQLIAASIIFHDFTTFGS